MNLLLSAALVFLPVVWGNEIPVVLTLALPRLSSSHILTARAKPNHNRDYIDIALSLRAVS